MSRLSGRYSGSRGERAITQNNSVRYLIKGLLTSGVYAAVAVAAVGFSAPAHAVLQLTIDVGGTIVTCADGDPCDTNSTPGVLQIANQTINGVLLNGAIQTQTFGPDALNTSSLLIANTTGASIPITAVISATDYPTPVTEIDWSGSGTWQSAVGSNITLDFFADTANGQGAGNPPVTPGTEIATFSNSPTLPVESFSDNGSTPFSAAGPFSMTEVATGTLSPFGLLVSRGQAEIGTAIPEPSTWAMAAIGFAGLGFAAYRSRRRSAISIV
jgi:hypothetical protein